jgi:hypothetical protein
VAYENNIRISVLPSTLLNHQRQNQKQARCKIACQTKITDKKSAFWHTKTVLCWG